MIQCAVRRSFKLAVASVMAMAFAGAAMAQPATAPAEPAKPAQTQPAGQNDADKKPAEKPATGAPGDAKPADSTTPAEKPVTDPNTKLYYVKMSTSKGDIFIELNNEKAPISTANFLKYVDKKYYDGTTFHRVMKDFMIQGGAFLPGNMNGEKPGLDKPIKNEWKNGLKNERGTLAMARTNDPDSARAQFFINVVDNPFLNDARPPSTAGYAVFGKVVGDSSMKVVDEIKKVKTGQVGPHGDVPSEPVVINSVVRIEASEAPKN